MKKKNVFLKTLALVLAFMLVFSCVGMSAFADEIEPDENGNVVIDETTTGTVSGDVPGYVYVYEGGDEKIAVDVTVTGSVGDGVEVDLCNGSSAKVSTGNVVSKGYFDGIIVDNDDSKIEIETGAVETGNGNEGVSIVSYGEGNTTVTTETVTSDAEGVSVKNYGGDVTVTTKDVVAEDAGVEVAGERQVQQTGEDELSLEAFKELGAEYVDEYDEIDVYRTADGKTYGKFRYDDDIYFAECKVITGQGSSVAEVNGNVTVSGNEEDVYGVKASNDNPEITSEIDVFGNVTVTSTDSQFTYGADATAHEGSAKVVVSGKVDVTGEGEYNWAYGVNDEANGKNTEATVVVSGGIKVDAGDAEGTRAVGVFAGARDEGFAETVVSGGIEATGQYARGIEAIVSGDGTVEVNVEGDIQATGEAETGTAGIYTNNLGGTIDIHVAGDVDSTGDGLNMTDRPYDLTLTEDDVTAGTTRVEVTGDVTAAEAGARIDLVCDESKMDVIVDGTLSGESQSVLVSEETIADNLTLTVWEIKENKDGNLVERKAADGTTEADEELEKKIQYIIKIDPAQEGYITTQGTTAYESYNVAKEGDTVTLKLNIPAGYKFISAFNGTTEKVQLLQDANGNYYLVVPRGGGVMLSLELEKIQTASTTKLTRAYVTFNLNGGTMDGKTGTYTVETWIGKAVKLGTPEQEGYDFLGWNVQQVKADDPEFKEPDENSEVQAGGTSIKVESTNVTVTAVWKKK